MHSAYDVFFGKGKEKVPDNASMQAARPEEAWEADIHFLDHQYWHFDRPKDLTGKKNPGKQGGFYQHKVDGKKVFFKQDPDIAKNISEFVASRVKRAFAAPMGMADRIARVELAYDMVKDEKGRQNVKVKGDFVEPSEDGKGIYVASVMFENFQSVNVDARVVNNLMYKDTKTIRGRHKYFDFNARQSLIEINETIANDRYQGLPTLLAFDALIDNPDVHFDNFGCVPKPGTEGEWRKYVERKREREENIYTLRSSPSGQYRLW